MRTVPGRTDSVVVVGAGLGGLSAALRLAGAHRHVTVLEREAVPGGRCGLLQRHGYRFDTGPTVLTMPDLLADTFAAVGEDMDDWLTLRRLDPTYRARFADGTGLTVHADVDATADEIRALCGAHDADGFHRYVRHLAELYRLQLPHFIDRNLDSPLQLLGLPLARLTAMRGFGRLGPQVARFVDDERLQRVLSFQAMYAGLAPMRALALYGVITYFDTVAGVYFPDGGMHAVPRALAGAAARHGVEFRFGTTVTRVEISGGRASAVLTADGDRIPADVVVVNADLPVAYRDLLPPGYTPRRVRRLRYSPSAVMLHAGVRPRRDDAPDTAAHHTITFGAEWERTFRELIDDGTTMSDPSFLVTTPTRTDPALAPPDRHAQYVLFPAPNLDHRRPIEWHHEGARYRDHIHATLAARGYPGFAESVEFEHLVTPTDWSAQGLAAGAPFSAAHHFRQTGPFRAATLDRRIENLVFCGANTQPGVGVPMVLVSGRLAAARITG